MTLGVGAGWQEREHHNYGLDLLDLPRRFARFEEGLRVITGLLQSDSPVYDHSNRVTANRLLKAGVRVYLYPGMTHVKALAVDGVWAYTGTGNFDTLSLRAARSSGTP